MRAIVDHSDTGNGRAMKRVLLLLLVVHAGIAAGDDIGRLFFTPAQRATLDNARKQNVHTEVGNDNPDQAVPLPQNLIVNGVVRRSDGKNTVWVNGRPVTDRQSNGVNVIPDKNNRVRVTVPDSGRSVDLKAGQTLELNSGTVQEGYALRPSAPAAANPENTNGAPPATPAAVPNAPAPVHKIPDEPPAADEEQK